MCVILHRSRTNTIQSEHYPSTLHQNFHLIIYTPPSCLPATIATITFEPKKTTRKKNKKKMKKRSWSWTWTLALPPATHRRQSHACWRRTVTTTFTRCRCTLTQNIIEKQRCRMTVNNLASSSSSATYHRCHRLRTSAKIHSLSTTLCRCPLFVSNVKVNRTPLRLKALNYLFLKKYLQ